MPEVKPWYQSKTILSLAALAILQVFRRLGMDIMPADAQELAPLLIDGVSALFLALAAHGRVTAKSSIASSSVATSPGAPTIVPALLLVFGLALAGPVACASLEAETPAQRVYAVQADLLTPINMAGAYVARDDADPVIKERIQKLVKTASEAVHAAQDAARDGDDPAIPALLEVAKGAGAELFSILKDKGVF